MDVKSIRQDFPILSSSVNGYPLVYLDNAATTQVPRVILDRISAHYETSNANVHRGMHHLAHMSTDALEDARGTVARFVNAPNPDGVVFTRGTTDSLNMAAQGLKHLLKPGDKVIVSVLEHHSNFIPWKQICSELNAELVVIDINEQGDIDLSVLEEELENGNVRIIALSGCSNVLGSVLPARTVADLAHQHGALFVLDGAQLMRHGIIDIQDIGCDFLAFSGHKMMAGTGIGVLCGPMESMGLLHPRDFGGEMVSDATLESCIWEDLPLRLEAGTPNYVGAIALATACDYLTDVGRLEVAKYEDGLIKHACNRLEQVDGLTILGAPERRCGAVSFTIENVHPFDLCALIDTKGIALRSGHNCAQPLLKRLGLNSVSRMSPAFYNTAEEIDFAVLNISRAAKMLRKAQS